MQYNVEVEFKTSDFTDENADLILDAYAGMSPAVGRSLYQHLQVTVTVDAADLRQAVALTLGAAPGDLEVLSVTAVPTTVWDRRLEQLSTSGIPPLASLTEAAELLGTSRQAVHQRLQSGSLPGVRVGSGWVILRSALPDPE